MRVGRRTAFAGLTLVRSMVVTAIYHLGYSEFPCGRCLGGYSFTAPVVVFMIRFWNTKNTTATGIVITAAAASLRG